MIDRNNLKFITKNSGVQELARYGNWKTLRKNGNKRRGSGSTIKLISSTFCIQQGFAIQQSPAEGLDAFFVRIPLDAGTGGEGFL